MPQDEVMTGIVGVGLMGHGIAKNILQSGRKLTYLQHAGNQPVEDLLDLGAQAVDTLAQLAAQCQVIILCVTGSPQVEQIIYAEEGLLAHLAADSVVIDCSTSMPDSTVRIHQSMLQAGSSFIDAAMTRTPKEAEAGRLNLIVGAEPELFESQRPLLQSFAENITLAGPVGSGHRMKLLHNFVSLGFSAIVAEAAACAHDAQIDPAVFIEVLANGGGASVVLDRLTPYIRDSDDSSFRFSIDNAAKDLGYYADMLAASGSTGKAASCVREVYAQAQQILPEHSSVPQLIDFLSRKPA